MSYLEPLNPPYSKFKKERRNLKVTYLEHEAWKLSDSIAKTIELLHKNIESEATRKKLIRDFLKDNFISFYKRHSNTKEIEVIKDIK